MGDFFSRVAERALGYGAGIRPDFAPESTVDSGRANRDISEGTRTLFREPRPVEATGTKPAVQPVALQLGEDESRQPEGRMEDTLESTSHQPALPKWDRSRVPPETEPVNAVRRNSNARHPPSVERSSRPTRKRLSPDNELPTHETVASVRQVIPQPVASNRTAQVESAPEQVLAISRDTPQTIHVSIGRVEVRAVTPMAAAPRERPRERHTAVRLSLDEYLRQRNKKRR